MKLEKTGSSIMLIPSLILFAGCKQSSGYDRLVSEMDHAKAIHTQYVIHVKGQNDIAIDFLYSKPNRFLVTSSDFSMHCNEIDGHYEEMLDEKKYDLLPWDNKPYPGTGKLLAADLIHAGPASATNPKDFAPNKKWELKSKKDGVETYSKTVDSVSGPQTFTMKVGTDGMPKSFEGPGVVYEVKKFEYVDEQPIEKFRISPADGFVCIRVPVDHIPLETGQKFDWSGFKAASDVQGFSPKGPTMFAIVDPKEPTSARAMDWIRKAGQGYTKVMVSKGEASSGFYDPTGEVVDKITTTTPLFLMVSPDGTVKAMWLGFDADGIPAFEADIQKALSAKD
ncbi:MAG: hypothetical protein JST51_11900 [Armatimonadetes bacterium]|nr:hypothetical protein [Armatimonadota bacterium]